MRSESLGDDQGTCTQNGQQPIAKLNTASTTCYVTSWLLKWQQAMECMSKDWTKRMRISMVGTTAAIDVVCRWYIKRSLDQSTVKQRVIECNGKYIPNTPTIKFVLQVSKIAMKGSNRRHRRYEWKLEEQQAGNLMICVIFTWLAQMEFKRVSDKFKPLQLNQSDIRQLTWSVLKERREVANPNLTVRKKRSGTNARKGDLCVAGLASCTSPAYKSSLS